ncbi:MAG: GntR family transcriptional regulator [Anaerolineales bacterium]|nr:GntR family transcriptional regulator [Anaerolineales bacterium]
MKDGLLNTNRNSRPNISEIQVRIAEYLLCLEPDGALKSVRDLADMFDVSVGTISKAIQDLESMGVVKITHRGHLGSFLEEKSIGGLWQIIQDGPFVIAITIPSNIRFEGMATALKQLLEKNNIPTYFIFIRGSSMRLRALQDNRCNAVVLSRLTAEGECSTKEKIALELPTMSWLTENRVYFRKGVDSYDDGIKVGVDLDSYDHRYMTDIEFQDQSITRVNTNFTQLPRLLYDARIDATIWNAEEPRLTGRQDILSRPVSDSLRAKLAGRDNRATLVIRKDDSSVQRILRDVIDVDILMEIQERVVSGLLLPEY